MVDRKDIDNAVRQEKGSSKLSALEDDFYQQSRKYLQALHEDLKKCEPESSKYKIVQLEIKNTKRQIEKLFELRLWKILKKSALKKEEEVNFSTASLTLEERNIYTEIRKIIHSHQQLLLDITGPAQTTPPAPEAPVTKNNMSPGTAGPTREITSKPGAPITSTPGHIIEAALPRTTSETEGTAQETATPAQLLPEEITVEQQETRTPRYKEHSGHDFEDESCRNKTGGIGKRDINKEYVIVRAIQDIPRFRGSDLHDYTLAKDDVAVLPSMNAEALCKRNIAIKINVKY